MTEKIIVDGVNVGGCKYFGGHGQECSSEDLGMCSCDEHPDCLYKQLQAEKQKVEMYKQALGEIKENVNKMKILSENDCGELTDCFFIDRNCDRCSEDKCLAYWFEQLLQQCEVLND